LGRLCLAAVPLFLCPGAQAIDETAPATVVDRHLAAYNARDLAAFTAEFAEDVKVYRPPAAEPVIVGKPALAEFYGKKRFNKVGLHSEILQRIVMGNKVIDHERITGLKDQPIEATVVSQVSSGRIQTLWIFSPE